MSFVYVVVVDFNYKDNVIQNVRNADKKKLQRLDQI